MENIEQVAVKNAHIPTYVIEQDITDTEREIAKLEEEAKHYEGTPSWMRDARFNQMRASECRRGIGERKEFVGKLKAILEYRAKEA